jgi:hypothetical protein
VAGHGRRIPDGRFAADTEDKLALDPCHLGFVRDRVQQMKSQENPLAELKKRLKPEIRAKYEGWNNPNWIKYAMDNFYNSTK